MLKVEQCTRRFAWVVRVDQDRALSEQIPILLPNKVDHGVEKRLAGAYEGSERLALDLLTETQKGRALRQYESQLTRLLSGERVQR